MLVRAMDGGGAQRDAIELANGLWIDGWPMLIATFDHSGPLKARVTPGMPLLDLGQGRKLRMALAANALRAMIAGLQPRAVIASEAAANILLVHAAALHHPRWRPQIILREVTAPVAARRSDPYWQNRLAYHLAPRFYPRADAVLSLTTGTRRELIEHFDVAPERAINLGTNAVLTQGRIIELAQPVPRDANHVVAVGRLSPEKDFANLVRALAVLRDDRPSLRLTIIGEGPERQALERLIAQLDLRGSVSLPGYDANPVEVVRRAGLFVSTSRHEGFGNAIVEALACGTPVVATDAPYGPREILANGRFGLLVPPGNLAALIHAMTRALAAPADTNPLRARAARYSTEAAVDRVAEVFAGLGLEHASLAEVLR